MRGLRGEGIGAELSLSIWLCLCPRLQTLNHSNFTLSNKPTGGIQRQDPNLQRKLNTDLSGPAAVVLCPQCLQWIFVYSPNISPAPWPPRQTEIRVPLPSHSVSQVPIIPVPDHSSLRVPLLHPWKTPPPPSPADSQVWWASYFTFIKSIKIILNENP